MSQYLCPDCGSDSKVMDTRPSYNRLRRRRVCTQKSHKFSTVEVPIEAPQKIMDLVEFALSNIANMDDDMVSYINAQTREIMLGLIEKEPDIANG